MILNLIKKYWLYILLILTIVGIIFYFTTCNPNPSNTTIYVHDTTIVERYIEQVSRDTVIKWYERVQWKENKPDTLYYDRVDTAFIIKIQDYDVMLSVKKSGSDLYIYALNQNGKLLKEYVYKNVGNDFTATSTTNNIFVKSKLWYWVTPELSYEQIRPVEDLKSFTHSVDILTGVDFKNKYFLKAGVGYDITSKDLQLKAKVTIKPF